MIPLPWLSFRFPAMNFVCVCQPNSLMVYAFLDVLLLELLVTGFLSSHVLSKMNPEGIKGNGQ